VISESTTAEKADALARKIINDLNEFAP